MVRSLQRVACFQTAEFPACLFSVVTVLSCKGICFPGFHNIFLSYVRNYFQCASHVAKVVGSIEMCNDNVDCGTFFLQYLVCFL